MASKSPLFILFFTIITMVMTVQMTDAQLFGQNLNITGSVFCSLNGSSGVVNASVPPFPNATVQLECGSGNVLASTTTNSAGSFSIIVSLITYVVNIFSGCKIVVPTPLSSCNASLPSTGSLFSPLQKIGPDNFNRILNVTNGFQFLP
ncbi:phylloplanin-like [Impatiens glandulifera]|uniref:phylloplanin-like n=1 Tax=Impatiens glandulifera TaxID=253017 RepID=UPI001FB0F9F7|nr:phylloplanin-like [Impatiens glandulifera]